MRKCTGTADIGDGFEACCQDIRFVKQQAFVPIGNTVVWRDL